MSDILDELKYWSASTYPTDVLTDDGLRKILDRAAAEIERLRDDARRPLEHREI